MENRLELLAKYYNVGLDVIEGIAAIPSGDNRGKQTSERKVILAQFGIGTQIFRTMVNYSRYTEAAHILAKLNSIKRPIEGLRVLDFGCGVSDYGVFFARRGAKISVCDKAEMLNFVKFRFDQQNLSVELIDRDNPGALFMGKDLVIFGEVLEHLDDPLSVLRTCGNASVKYIFTSSYPFGKEDYYNQPGHNYKAKNLRIPCLDLLTAHYEQNALFRNRNLWIKK
jgi:SAM-dependent methyltransferase